MYGRSFAIAASLILGSPAIAEPVATQAVHQASQSNDQRGPTVLASAADVKLPAVMKGEQAPAPKKRAARVTTCRCGGDVAKQP